MTQPTRTLALCTLVPLALVALAASRLTSTLIAGALGGAPPSARAPEPPVVSPHRRSVVPTAALRDGALFADAREPEATRPVDRRAGRRPAGACAASTRRARLVGTVVSGDRRRSLAVFSDPAQLGSLALYEGDTLEDATVVEIAWREVVVETIERCERLVLTEAEPTDLAATDPTPTATEPSLEALGASIRATDHARVVPRAVLLRGLSRLAELGREVRPTPVRQGGQLVGYRLRLGRARALGAQLGLVDGDVVRAVDGAPLDSPAVLGTYGTLTTARSLELEVLRDGQPRTLRYTIED
jgi:general secretion pathway protein C